MKKKKKPIGTFSDYIPKIPVIRFMYDEQLSYFSFIWIFSQKLKTKYVLLNILGSLRLTGQPG